MLPFVPWKLNCGIISVTERGFFLVNWYACFHLSNANLYLSLLECTGTAFLQVACFVWHAAVYGPAPFKGFDEQIWAHLSIPSSYFNCHFYHGDSRKIYQKLTFEIYQQSGSGEAFDIKIVAYSLLNYLLHFLDELTSIWRNFVIIKIIKGSILSIV